MKVRDAEGTILSIGDDVIFVANGYPTRGYIYKYSLNKNKIYMTSNARDIQPIPHAHKECSGGRLTDRSGNLCWYVIKI